MAGLPKRYENRFQRVGVAADKVGRTIPPLRRLCPSLAGELGYGLPKSKQRAVKPRQVDVPGVGRVRVVGQTTPLRPTIKELVSRSHARLCQAGYLVEDAKGVQYAADAGFLKERARTPREGLCPYHARLYGPELAEYVASMEAAARAGEVSSPRDDEVTRDLPYPHRRGSSPCCAASEWTPERALAVLDAWESGDGYESTTPEEIVAIGRAAVTRERRREVEHVEDVRPALEGQAGDCWNQWREAAALALLGRRQKFKRLKSEAVAFTSRLPPVSKPRRRR